MTSFVSYMDNHTPKCIGENSHLQEGWSHSESKLITQLYFQLVRTKDYQVLETQWNKILRSFKGFEIEKLDELNMVLKMVANVRDIKNGKGEQQLSFMMLYNLWNYYPKVAENIFSKFLYINSEEHSYGSIKDVKYFCNYVYERSYDKNHKIINYVLSLCVELLNMDIESFNKKEKITLFGKWFPRNKSNKFGWINKKFALMYYKNIMNTAQTCDQKYKAEKKCLRNLRKELSKLNKYLDTTQIKMASNDWKSIDFDKVTGPTLRIHRNAFNNKDKRNKMRSQKEDRIICANNLKEYLSQVQSGNKKINAKTVQLYKLVKNALISNESSSRDLLNALWKESGNSVKDLSHYIIPMCDVSGSMTCDECIPLYNSIALSLRLSEKTHPDFRNRILTFSEDSSWMKINPTMTFCEKVNIIRNDKNWGTQTNIYKAFEMILNVCVENNIPPTDVEKMILAIFSDMQINVALSSRHNLTILMENIKLLYNEAGLKTKWKMPYPVPHILFWNLRKTEGFPCQTEEPNTTMISGFNPVLVNTFAEKGFDELKKMTPSLMLKNILSNSRYNHIEYKI